MSNINFACKQFPIDQVLRCSFSLSNAELFVLKQLLKSQKYCAVADIAKTLKKDRTTVQRSLQSLYRKGLLDRHQANLGKGGYYFTYSAKPKGFIKKRVDEYFKHFETVVYSELEKW